MRNCHPDNFGNVFMEVNFQLANSAMRFVTSMFRLSRIAMNLIGCFLLPVVFIFQDASNQLPRGHGHLAG